ncbi:MAG: hypothetical protein A2X63_00060 [Ignavibacteria bacterium GWA2_35_8]|nr:MAG: hypothetical protein A2X63_00060 [Ignavibacteria bacterium GWA2_35_8]
MSDSLTSAFYDKNHLHTYKIEESLDSLVKLDFKKLIEKITNHDLVSYISQNVEFLKISTTLDIEKMLRSYYLEAKGISGAFAFTRFKSL